MRFRNARRAGFRTVASVVAVAAAVFGMAAPASANVPAYCGPWSGLAVPAGYTLYDFSASAVPIGTQAAPYFVPAVIDVIVVGSGFNDVIVGTAFADVLCGGPGADTIDGGSGDDEIYGGPDGDVLSGEENSDFISGAEGNDYIYGDATVATGFDTGDTLQGGADADHLYGGAFPDTIRGGSGGNDNDYADGGPSMMDTCTEIEQLPVNCP
jgi:hypothetical protein